MFQRIPKESQAIRIESSNPLYVKGGLNQKQTAVSAGPLSNSKKSSRSVRGIILALL